MTDIPLRESPLVDRVVVGALPVLTSKTDHRHALIYWHGFPGPYSAESDGVIRIADQIFEAAKAGAP